MKIKNFITCVFFVKNWQCLTLRSSQSKRLTIARCKMKWLCSYKNFYVPELSEKIWLCVEKNQSPPSIWEKNQTLWTIHEKPQTPQNHLDLANWSTGQTHFRDATRWAQLQSYIKPKAITKSGAYLNFYLIDLKSSMYKKPEM